MILTLNYEETRALRSGAANLLSGEGGGQCAVMAPPEAVALVERLVPKLEGDLSFQSLQEMRATQRAVDAILECLRSGMSEAILATHPADESAVAAYFEYAHVLSVAGRLEEMADEMKALIELVTGEPVTAESVPAFEFPD